MSSISFLFTNLNHKPYIETTSYKNELPEAVNFDGSPTNYQEFMTSMGFYFWARHEVFRGNNSGILSFAQFHDDFSWTFSDPNYAIIFRGLIRKPRKCTRSITTYVAEFRIITRDSVFDQLALFDQFLRELLAVFFSEIYY
ncbi:hypothetical protein AYI68_g3738 [Smittium mucronatum]|uniref:Retrotransposon gag domain-containing protein n=1 Tax=Smittium mucronatum TaxID=133383 RepID=A0A1R0GZ44_9FUNG|nr:hypothetical protein AYI68_g3738 [Smittium mucronatum]